MKAITQLLGVNSSVGVCTPLVAAAGAGFDWANTGAPPLSMSNKAAVADATSIESAAQRVALELPTIAADGLTFMTYSFVGENPFSRQHGFRNG
jgi:hypothetical protein